MTETLVVDASVAIKWVVDEVGTDRALNVRAFGLIAPQLIVAECANILWRKVARRELTRDEAILAMKLLEQSGVALVSMRGLGDAALALAIDLGHPAYDFADLALALQRGLRFVTADRRLLAIVRERATSEIAAHFVGLEAF